MDAKQLFYSIWSFVFHVLHIMMIIVEVLMFFHLYFNVSSFVILDFGCV